MSRRKGIYWLASYPKSGNTWFRIILTHILSHSTSLDYINGMDTILGSTLGVNRAWINKILGFDSTLLTDEELEEARWSVYKWTISDLKTVVYNKIHDAYIYLRNKQPLIPSHGSLGAIYFIRNPLDVAISLAHHANCSVDWSIHMMGNEDFVMPLDRNHSKQLRQKLLSWSQHVQSWEGVRDLETIILRYEDMLKNPVDTFKKGLGFLQLQVSEEELKKAIEATSFTKLQQYEANFGFKEKPAIKGNFFRKGIIGDWESTLTDAQIQKVIQDHGKIMRCYGYLSETGEPTK